MSAHKVIAKHWYVAPGGCSCGHITPHDGTTLLSWLREQHAVHQLDAFAAAGYAVVKADEYQRDLAAIAEWQRSALIVITAANQFVADCVTGDGNPVTVANALIDSGWDGRAER